MPLNGLDNLDRFAVGSSTESNVNRSKHFLTKTEIYRKQVTVAKDYMDFKLFWKIPKIWT